MKPKKAKPRSLKKEARARFVKFIAEALAAQPDVGTDTLAKDFYTKEERLLRKISYSVIVATLVKWADDILNQSVVEEVARNGNPQMVLPMSLAGVQLPGALSFINGANQLRFVASYKADWHHVDSHAFILRKHEQEVHEARVQYDLLRDTVQPFMEGSDMLLPEALRLLCESEAGAA